MTNSAVTEPQVDEDYKLHRRFDRIGRLVGDDGMARLFGSRVAVIGLGGVGSFAAESLARSGVGCLDLDARQGTLRRYIKNRLDYVKANNLLLPSPTYAVIERFEFELEKIAGRLGSVAGQRDRIGLKAEQAHL